MNEELKGHRTRNALATVAAIATACLSAAAQVENPASFVDGIEPVSGGTARNLVAPGLNVDPRIDPPAHPPIDQIPPMPIPHPDFDGISNNNATRGMTYYDAESGITGKLPEFAPSGLDHGSLADGFNGQGGVAQDGEFSVRGFGSMFDVGAATTFPRRGNVKLVMEFTDQAGNLRYFTCSGTMADAGVVLCAAHCVYARSPNGINIFDWADQIWVYPGWDGVGSVNGGPDSDEIINDWGWARGTFYMAGTDYVDNGNFDRDAGLIRINQTSSRNVGMLTGWFSWAWGFGCGDIQSRTYYNYSFPGEGCGTVGLHNGRDMYYWAGTWDSCPGNQLQLDTGGGCFDTVWGGMSGSGAYYQEGDTRYIHAVCSNSNRDTRGRYTKLWEQFITDMGNFETDTRTSTFDLEALMFRTNGTTNVRAGNTISGSTVQIVNATNANPGSATYTVHVYLSSNNNISTGDTLLGTWNYTTDFAAMQNRTFNIPTLTIPVTTSPGTYFIGAVIDQSEDGNFSNNDSDTWDAQQISVTVGLPDVVSSPSPTHFGSNVDNNANLDWASSARATSYRVYFGTDSTPDAGEFQGTAISSFWNLPTLTYGTTYYWRIDAQNSAGTTTGPIWRFTVEPDFPAAPSSPFPAHFATDVDINANLDWATAARATSYNVYFGTDPTPDFTEFQTSTGFSFYSLPPLLPDTTYYWRIDAVNSTGTTTGPIWRFRTEANCLCELDGAPRVTTADLLEYLALWFANANAADLNGDRVINAGDLLEFLACWFPASSSGVCN